MSDSELSDAPSTSLPPDHEIEATLKKEVKKAAKGPVENYTVSKIRKSVEVILNLPDGFFKGDEEWKSRSKAVIEEQVAKESAPDSPQPKVKRQSSDAKVETKRPPKRASPKPKSSQPRKKQKLDSEEESSSLSSPPSDSEPDFEEEVKPQKSSKDKKKPAAAKPKPKPKPKPKAKSKPKAEAKESASEDDADERNSEAVADDKNGSESEMSVVLDEAPTKKSRSKSKSADTAEKKSNASKPKPSAEADPDQEEIKKLQGWLVKCGIRKVWGKELKPFSTSKAKIKHLKEMLSDAGMSGRYSNEKAAQIKEARELAADIEAVQEGNERWGKSGEEDNAEGDDDLKTRGGRRLVRGAKNYDFLSSDGEETD